MGNDKRNDEVTYEIAQHIGVIAKYSNGWTKELNRISWNGGNCKFDIRDWDEHHEHMSRGVTLRDEEMKNVYQILRDSFEDQVCQSVSG